MTSRQLAWLLGLLLLPSAAATATNAGPSRGELLAAACNACHGVDGAGSGSVPPLRVPTPCATSRLESRLEAWREQPEADGAAHLMIRFARGLSPDDITALAAWYRPEPDASCR